MRTDCASSAPHRLAARPGAPRRSPAQDAHERGARDQVERRRGEDISDSPVPGIYQVAVGANVAYVTKDGRYIIRGDIYDAETSANVSEETRSRARVAMLSSVDPESMIVFKPARTARSSTRHDFHGHRLRLLPAIPSRDRQGHGARHRGPLSVFSAHGPEHGVVDEGRPSLVRCRPQRAR